jgi:hypothetical protein
MHQIMTAGILLQIHNSFSVFVVISIHYASTKRLLSNFKVSSYLDVNSKTNGLPGASGTCDPENKTLQLVFHLEFYHLLFKVIFTKCR